MTCIIYFKGKFNMNKTYLKAKNMSDNKFLYYTFELKNEDLINLEEQFLKIEQTITAILL